MSPEEIITLFTFALGLGWGVLVGIWLGIRIEKRLLGSDRDFWKDQAEEWRDFAFDVLDRMTGHGEKESEAGG